MLYTCTECKATYTEETGLGEVTEHAWVLDADASTAATGTEARKNVYTCSKCGAIQGRRSGSAGPRCGADGGSADLLGSGLYDAYRQPLRLRRTEYGCLYRQVPASTWQGKAL